jgi:hypothetical protein
VALSGRHSRSAEVGCWTVQATRYKYRMRVIH